MFVRKALKGTSGMSARICREWAAAAVAWLLGATIDCKERDTELLPGVGLEGLPHLDSPCHSCPILFFCVGVTFASAAARQGAPPKASAGFDVAAPRERDTNLFSSSSPPVKICHGSNFNLRGHDLGGTKSMGTAIFTQSPPVVISLCGRNFPPHACA